MTQNDEFVKPMNNYTFDVFDKDMEGDFSLEDILIKENNIYKINIKPANKGNNIQNNNNNLNIINNINFRNDVNNMNKNVINNINNINMNDMINNNMIINNNNINNLVNMNNNINKMNNSEDFIKNINMNNMNDIINMDNMDNNNLISNNSNDNYMNNNFLIKYNVLFQTTNNIKYCLIVYGRTKIDTIIKKYEAKMGIIKIISSPQYSYRREYIFSFSSVFDYFKNGKNPIIIVKDDEYLIGKLIHITFQIDNGEKYSLIFNTKSDTWSIKNNFLNEVGVHGDSIKFFYNNHQMVFNLFFPETIIGDFFKSDKNPLIIVKDPYNLIGHKIQVTFKTNHGYKHKMNVNSGKTIGDILIKYLAIIDEIFIYGEQEEKYVKFPKKIKFIYNGKEIKLFDEKKINNKEYFINIGTYFKNDNNPTIFVNDPNNLFLINWYQSKNITFKQILEIQKI